MAGKLCSLSPLSETHPDKVQRLPVYPLETMDIKPTPHWYHPKPTSFPKVLKVGEAPQPVMMQWLDAEAAGPVGDEVPFRSSHPVSASKGPGMMYVSVSSLLWV